MAIDITELPATWPDSETITAAAKKIRGLGEDVVDDTGDVLTKWQGLSQHYSTPDTERVTSAPETRMKPVAKAAKDALSSIADTLDSFAGTMSENKSRYDQVKIDAANYTPSPDVDRTPGMDPEKARIKREITAVATIYNDATKKTSDEVQKPDIAGLKLPDGVVTVKDYYTKFVTWAGRTQGLSGQFRWFHGKVVFSYSKDLNPFRVKMPKTFGVTTKALKKLNVTPGLLRRLTGTQKDNLSNNKVNKAYKNTPLQRLLTKHPYLVSTFNNFNLQIKNGTVTFRIPLTRPDPKTKNQPVEKKKHGQTKATRKINGLMKSPLVKFAGPLGTGFDAYDNYTDSYNASVARDPSASTAKHVADASVDTAIKTGSQVAGTAIGTVAGATAFSFIPIPGATVVGGYLGGLAGEYLGGQAGDLINAWRHGEVGKVVDEKVDAAKDFAKGVGSALNPFD